MMNYSFPLPNMPFWLVPQLPECSLSTRYEREEKGKANIDQKMPKKKTLIKWSIIYNIHGGALSNLF